MYDFNLGRTDTNSQYVSEHSTCYHPYLIPFDPGIAWEVFWDWAMASRQTWLSWVRFVGFYQVHRP